LKAAARGRIASLQQHVTSGQGWPRSDRRKPIIWMISARDSPAGRRQRSRPAPTGGAPRPRAHQPRGHRPLSPRRRPPSRHRHHPRAALARRVALVDRRSSPNDRGRGSSADPETVVQKSLKTVIGCSVAEPKPAVTSAVDLRWGRRQLRDLAGLLGDRPPPAVGSDAELAAGLQRERGGVLPIGVLLKAAGGSTVGFGAEDGVLIGDVMGDAVAADRLRAAIPDSALLR
jgi:hypothetical protein